MFDSRENDPEFLRPNQPSARQRAMGIRPSKNLAVWVARGFSAYLNAPMESLVDGEPRFPTNEDFKEDDERRLYFVAGWEAAQETIGLREVIGGPIALVLAEWMEAQFWKIAHKDEPRYNLEKVRALSSNLEELLVHLSR